MIDAEPGGERTARRSPRRSLVRGGAATASSNSCCMMLHSDHIRAPHGVPGQHEWAHRARHPSCEGIGSSVGAATRLATTDCRTCTRGSGPTELTIRGLRPPDRRARAGGPRWWLAPLRLFFVHHAARAPLEVLHGRSHATEVIIVPLFSVFSYGSGADPTSWH